MSTNWSGERMEPGIFSTVSIEHLHRYALALSLCAGKKVLDIACGEGYGANLLATKAFHVTGVDIDAPVVEAAAKKYQEKNLAFRTGTATALTFPDESFDLIVSFETLEHVEDQETMMREFKRVLKKEGLLLISTPDKQWYSDARNTSNPFHVKELYKDEFSALLQRHFMNNVLLEQKYLSGSFIQSAKNESLQMLKGSFRKIEEKQLEALYLIALASDGALPQISSSFFEGNEIYELALSQQEAAFRSTLTYRTGHLLLKPFKWIRKKLRSS